MLRILWSDKPGVVCNGRERLEKSRVVSNGRECVEKSGVVSNGRECLDRSQVASRNNNKKSSLFFFRARTYLGNESNFLEGLCMLNARKFEAITGL